MFIKVVCLAVYQRNVSAWDSCDWSSKAIINSQLQSPYIEIIEVAVEGSIAIGSLQMSVMVWSESLAEKVSNVAENDENEVADVSGQEVVVRGFVDNRLVELASPMLADISMVWAS
jgi:hypothetical protein